MGRKENAAGSRGTGTMVAALVLAALVPAVGVLWFMTVAMRNERLAVQERLATVYSNQLTSLQRQVTAHWQARLTALQPTGRLAPAQIFAAAARTKLADGVVVLGGAGKALYPTAALVEARADENSVVARALQSQAAVLLQAGQKQLALAKLAELVGDPRLRHAVGARGVLIVPNAQLLILKLIGPALAAEPPRSAGRQNDDRDGVPASGSPTGSLRQQTLADLVTRLNDYGDAALSSSQRRFLMREVKALAPGAAIFPTLEAEELAAEYLDHDPARPADARLQRTPLAKVWRLPVADGTLVALFREERVRAELATAIGALTLPDAQVTVLAPGEAGPADRRVPSLDASELLPGWRLALSFNGTDPLALASERQSRFYLWMGVGVVAIIAVLALMLARTVAAQMRLARLKNELVSTVSHELKTPLASMRALVDTLAAGRFRDERQLQDYLHLIVKENVRLSHVIENFLAFSRMERGQQRFHFEALAPAEVVRAAVEALQEKLEAPNCQFEMSVPPDLPRIRGDAEALATVLINLLDNACKYTNGEKRIAVRGVAESDSVRFEVEDNGIGLALAETRKIFDRFYQVDQSLTRQRGGCGLGLSIVKFIVEAHRGSVEVKSEPGKGSTFRVRIPRANETTNLS